MVSFSQIRECHYVTRVVIVALFVCYPDFYPGYLYSGNDIGQHGHVYVITVAEEVGQEEVSILIVVAGINLKICYLLSALRVDC